jgi:hypothetical protein
MLPRPLFLEQQYLARRVHKHLSKRWRIGEPPMMMRWKSRMTRRAFEFETFLCPLKVVIKVNELQTERVWKKLFSKSQSCNHDDLDLAPWSGQTNNKTVRVSPRRQFFFLLSLIRDLESRKIWKSSMRFLIPLHDSFPRLVPLGIDLEKVELVRTQVEQSRVNFSHQLTETTICCCH